MKYSLKTGSSRGKMVWLPQVLVPKIMVRYLREICKVGNENIYGYINYQLKIFYQDIDMVLVEIVFYISPI